jgi:hypothetical protein
MTSNANKADDDSAALEALETEAKEFNKVILIPPPIYVRDTG